MLAPLLAVCSVLMARGASAMGLGEKIVYQEGSLLDADFRPRDRMDSVFHEAPETLNDGQFVELVKGLRVEVVAPSKDLAKMMNVVSTKSRARFLQDYEQYFKGFEVGSVSRPMLLSYLGLEFLEQEQLDSWYAPMKGRIASKVVQSCKALLASRAELHTANSVADGQLREIIKGDQMRKLHGAYLTYQNNLNLFMLENYLLLCSRLEPKKLSAELDESSFLLR